MTTDRSPISEVFGAFLRLGLTSFGGPVAHLGYFRNEFVLRRRWVSEEQFAELITLVQFLPGPLSSQLGFTLGLLRAGWAGAIAAFVAFTLPSALLLGGFAFMGAAFSGAAGEAVIHGLKLVAVCVIAQAVVGMSRRLTPDLTRIVIAVLGAIVVLLGHQPWLQLTAIGVGALLGGMLCRDVPISDAIPMQLPYGKGLAAGLLAAFAGLLVLSLSVSESAPAELQVGAGMYRAGALVFGGGHVVLPLLEQVVVKPGWLDADDFLAGYGAAQAIPGPMFSLSAYLGAKIDGVPLALLSVIAIFLPGFLVVGGALPFFSQLTSHRSVRTMLAGVNAAVVGLLAAALYDPVWTSAIEDSSDIAIAAVGFALLMTGRVSTLWVVAGCVGTSLVFG